MPGSSRLKRYNSSFRKVAFSDKFFRLLKNPPTDRGIIAISAHTQHKGQTATIASEVDKEQFELGNQILAFRISADP